MRKIVIIGTGNVGISYAYALLNQHINIDELVLIDIAQEKVEGQVMDLEHCLANLPQDIKIKQGAYKDCENADIICITAGAAQNGMKQSRMDDLKKGHQIMTTIIEQIRPYTFSGIYLIASNPLDVMTYDVWKQTGAEENRVIGSGTSLDSARLQYLISQKFQKPIHEIEGYVVGEHGDSQVVVWSSVKVEGKRVNLLPDEKEQIEEAVKRAGFAIVKRQGYTCYAIGVALARITKAIIENEYSVLPVSSYHKEYGVYISTPAKISASGVEENGLINLESEEQERLAISANYIRQAIEKINQESEK
ncbi:MAG: L-lactate dehydrogenase [Clostridia bacterium]